MVKRTSFTENLVKNEFKTSHFLFSTNMGRFCWNKEKISHNPFFFLAVLNFIYYNSYFVSKNSTKFARYSQNYEKSTQNSEKFKTLHCEILTFIEILTCFFLEFTSHNSDCILQFKLFFSKLHDEIVNLTFFMNSEFVSQFRKQPSKTEKKNEKVIATFSYNSVFFYSHLLVYIL